MILRRKTLRAMSYCAIALMAGLIIAGIHPDASFAQAWFQVQGLPFKLPIDIATLEESYQAPNSSMQLICIQDPEMDGRTQPNIAAALSNIIRQQKIRCVFQEAGTGDISLSLLRHHASDEKTQQVGEQRLEKGIIKAGEYASLAFDQDFLLWGVEDQGMYEKTMIAYATVLEKIGPLQKYTQYVETAVSFLKQNIYNTELQQFDKRYQSFIRDEISFAEYSRILEEAANRLVPNEVSIEIYPFFIVLNLFSRTERDINLDQAEKEKQQLLASLPPSTRHDFMSRDLHNLKPFKITINSPDEKQSLFILLSEQIKNQNTYPELVRYLKYLSEYQSIDRLKIRNLQMQVEKMLFEELIKSTDEKRLFEMADQIQRMRRFIDLSMSYQEFRQSKALINKVDFAAIANFINHRTDQYRLAYVKKIHAIPRDEAKDIFRGIIDFYEYTQKRRKIFLQNILGKMWQEGQDRGIFITATYHLPEMKKLFRKHNISYVVVTPLVDGKLRINKHYDALLLDQLFYVRPTVNMLYKPKPSREMINRLRPIMLWPVRTQLSFDLIYGRQPAFLSLTRDLGIKGKENLRLMLSVINQSLAGLRQVKSSLSSRMISLQTGLTRFTSDIPDDWVYSMSTTDYYLESAEPFSYAWFISTLQEIEKNHDAEKYESFKTFVEAKENTPEQKTSFERRLRNFEKSLIFSLAKAEVQNLAFIQRLRSMTTETSYFIERTQTLKALFALPLAYGVFWAQEAFNADKMEEHVRAELEEDYYPDAGELKKVAEFLRNNITPGGMPLSYRAPRAYWKSYKPGMNEVDTILERLIVQHSLSIYDGATWQIALMLMKNPNDLDFIDRQTDRLLSGSSGDLKEIKAHNFPFSYGDQEKVLNRENAYFFRIIADKYLQDDPGSTKNELVEFPNFSEFHHEDWKPITGEQAWAAMIGPLQVAYLKYSGRIPMECKEMQLALNMLPAFEAMCSPIGAIYYAPHGTHQKRPTDISNENNFSVYAALKMLYQVTKDEDPYLAGRVLRLLEGQEAYFRNYALDGENEVFYQGGFYENERFIPTKIFAMDCQTWGINTLGPRWIDRTFGEGTAYRIWQNAKRHGGYFDNQGILRGVGFTDGHKALSGEWTCGAILAAKLLSQFYKETRPSLSKELDHDVIQMRIGIEGLKHELGDDQLTYFYANRRHFMPFGWWANPIPSLISSTWVIMTDKGFNPFVLGGGADYDPNLDVKSLHVWPRPEEASGRWVRSIPKSLPLMPLFLQAKADAGLVKTVRTGLPVKILPLKPLVRGPLLRINPNPLLQHSIEEQDKAKSHSFNPQKFLELSVSTRAIGLFLVLLLLLVLLWMLTRRPGGPGK